MTTTSYAILHSIKACNYHHSKKESQSNRDGIYVYFLTIRQIQSSFFLGVWSLISGTWSAHFLLNLDPYLAKNLSKAFGLWPTSALPGPLGDDADSVRLVLVGKPHPAAILICEHAGSITRVLIQLVHQVQVGETILLPPASLGVQGSSSEDRALDDGPQLLAFVRTGLELKKKGLSYRVAFCFVTWSRVAWSQMYSGHLWSWP